MHLKSFEYLKARILGVPVIQSNWLTSSAEKGSWQPEMNFRVVKHPLRNSPIKMRPEKNLRLHSLSNFSFFVIPTEERENNIDSKKDHRFNKPISGLRAGQVSQMK